MRAVIVGVMGAGKSTVGPLVADALGVTFLDLDAVIEAKAGKAIPDIFIDDGEERFRARESEALRESLSTEGVLALGGGAILADANRVLLKDQTVVYLTVELADAIDRVGMGQGRPLLALNPRATLRHLMRQRQPLYQEVATITVRTDGRSPQEIADEVLAGLAA
jgi:shikimate kinase